MDTESLLYRLPKDRKRMLDAVADACHYHIYKTGVHEGFRHLSRSALSVKHSFYGVEFVFPQILAMYAEDKHYSAYSAPQFKGFLVLANLQSVNAYQKRVGVSAAGDIHLENSVMSVFSMEAAIRLLSEQNDLHILSQPST